MNFKRNDDAERFGTSRIGTVTIIPFVLREAFGAHGEGDEYKTAGLD